MSTQKQTAANRLNAQSSTGPTTEAGLNRSSRNSTVHGFTGQTVVVSPAEKPAYEAFVAAMLAEHNPETLESTELLYNYIDLRWSIQQITIQQNNILAIQNIITAQHLETGDFAAMDAALEAGTRRLKTLGIYEQRRRKAVKDTFEQFEALERQHQERVEEQLEQASDIYLSHKITGKSWDPKEFGFDCSLADIEDYLDRIAQEEAEEEAQAKRDAEAQATVEAAAEDLTKEQPDPECGI